MIEGVSMSLSDECFLTVWCTSYNFGEYLRNTFEGFLSQKTDFVFKVFVFDDASTDGSESIIQEYVQLYPEMFSAYISDINTYSDMSIRNKLLDELHMKYQQGKYVAVCEGDDYWNDPSKLQKQVDYLETHPECSMTVHSALWRDEIANKEYVSPVLGYDHYLNAEEVIVQDKGRIQTASYVYRKEDLLPEPEFSESNPWEYARILYEFSRGKIWYFDKPMSVYRYRHKGSWTEQYEIDVYFTAKTQWELQAFLEKYDDYTGHKYTKSINARLASNVLDAILLNPDISLLSYNEIIEKTKVLSPINKSRFKADRDRIGRIVRGLYTFSEQEKSLIDSCDHICIYGCGEYSKHIRKCLINNGYNIDGYLVSDGHSDVEILDGTTVYQLKDYPHDLGNTVVFVGVSQKFEIEIRRQLDYYGITNVIDIFWVQELKYVTN